METNFDVNLEAVGKPVFLIFKGGGWREMVLAADGTIPLGAHNPNEMFWHLDKNGPFNQRILYLLNANKEVTAVLKNSSYDNDVWHGSWMIGKQIRSVFLVYMHKHEVARKLSLLTKDYFVTAEDEVNRANTSSYLFDVLKVEDGYCKGFQASQKGNEVLGMLSTIYSRVKTMQRFIEIGTCDGGMFVSMLYFFRAVYGNVHGVSLDLNQRHMTPYVLKDDANLSFFQADSKSDKAKGIISNYSSFDFAFIDGDHSYSGALNDFNLVKDKTTHFGFHDIVESPGVVKLWKELKVNYASEYDFFEFTKPSPDHKDKPHLLSINMDHIGIGLMLRK